MLNERAILKELKRGKVSKGVRKIIVHNLEELVGIIVHNIPKDYKPSDKPLEDLKSIIVHN
ncbi:MAG: hypothetical protein EU548_09500 [Promethearchaeota archaeon]|nr:MAG: hypothetical protein EU548_09500 [Candidatus Lokiarchaeota archaeon]